MKEATTGQALEFRLRIRDLLRQRLLEAVEVVLAEELSRALGSESYERTPGRRGYRNGVEVRQVTTVAETRECGFPGVECNGRTARPRSSAARSCSATRGGRGRSTKRS